MHLCRFPLLLNELSRYGGDPLRLVSDFWRRDKPSWDHAIAMEEIGQAAFYDPDPRNPSRIRLPFQDASGGEIDPEAWTRWTAHDPVAIVDTRSENLRRMKLVYIDCGIKDQCNNLYGNRRFARKLAERRIPHVYEEFEDDHTAVDYRLDVSLPLVARALSAG